MAEAEDRAQLRKGAEIAERLLTMATDVLALGRKLPRDIACKHVISQVVRASSAAGANYEEARAAESRADFVHKVRIAAKEMRETLFWLRLIHRSSLVDTALIQPLGREANELAAILGASARTASTQR